MKAPTHGPSAGPLAGLMVAVTRPRTKGDRLAAELRRLGAEVVAAPALHLIPPRDPGPLARAAARLADFDWVAVTSATGIHALAEAAQAADGLVSAPTGGGRFGDGSRGRGGGLGGDPGP